MGYDFYRNAWSDASELNYVSNTFSLGASHEEKNWDAGIDYYYSFSFLNTEKFTNSRTIAPRIGFSLQPQLYTNISLSLSETMFVGDSARDAANLSTGFDQYLFFMENKAYTFLSYRYSDEDTTGSEFDYFSNLITVGVSFTDSDKFQLQLSYLYNLVAYKNETASIGAKRRDEKQTFALSITQPVSESMSMVLDYQNNITDSNLLSVDAKQNLLTFKIALSY